MTVGELEVRMGQKFNPPVGFLVSRAWTSAWWYANSKTSRQAERRLQVHLLLKKLKNANVSKIIERPAKNAKITI